MNHPIDPQNNEQQLAYNLIANTNSSFFLTGRAGTGKTTFLKNVQQLVSKRFIVLAPTGIAAINAGGETLHSFFRFPLRAMDINDRGELSYEKKEVLLNTDTIIIDEISMVRCDLVDAVDRTLRYYCASPLPFGGKQVIFTGDMFQLEPILSTDEDKALIRQNYETDTPYFFKAKVFERMKMVSIEFCKIYRQTDNVFIGILERIRNKQTTLSDLNTLNSRVCNYEDDQMIITLTGHNATAKNINDGELAKINAEEFTYLAEVDGQFKEKDFPSEKELKLKVGAQVMFTRNDGSGRWVNGTLGEVTALSADSVTVRTDKNQEYELEPVVWENMKYEYDKKNHTSRKEVIGTFTQYPLKTAWAITIHKSQGLTFDHVRLDLSRGVFANGQTYVALSRARSLGGLYLTTPVKFCFVKTSEEVLEFAEEFNNLEEIDFEIEYGKNVSELIAKKQFDLVAKRLMEMGMEQLRNFNVLKAFQLLNRSMDFIVCDDNLFGEIDVETDRIPQSPEADFSKAVYALYSGKHKAGISYIDSYIRQRGETYNALYIKSRLLTLDGRWQEADHLHDRMAEQLGNRMDSKLYYRGAVMNETHCNIPSLNLLQLLIRVAPNTLESHFRLREYLRGRNEILTEKEKSGNPLVEAFNGTLEDNSFEKILTENHQENSEAYTKYLSVIGAQVFAQ